MADNVVSALLLVLAVLVGAAVGSYIAWQPVAHKLDVAAHETMRSLEDDVRRAARNLEDLKIEVPQPHVETKITASLSPWSAFWIFLATVAGVLTARYYTKSRIPAYIKAALRGANYAKAREKRKRRKPRLARTSA